MIAPVRLLVGAGLVTALFTALFTWQLDVSTTCDNVLYLAGSRMLSPSSKVSVV